MARRRDTRIAEDSAKLRGLEERYRGKPEAARIMALRILREDPEISTDEVAAMVGYSIPSVKRWLKVYREGGLELLMQRGVRGKHAPSDEGVQKLTRKLMAGELQSFTDIRRWMDRYQRSLVDNRSVRQMASVAAGGRNGHGGAYLKDEGRPKQDGSCEATVISERVLKFLTNLPLSFDIRDWVAGFRPAFKEFLGDVDHITLVPNVHCNLTFPGLIEDGPSVMVNAVSGERSIVATSDDPDSGGAGRLARVLDHLRGRNFPFDKYHPPKGFVFYYAGNRYIGSMLLWRERTSPEISGETLVLIERLRNFLTFLFSYVAAYHQISNPSSRLLDQVLMEFSGSANEPLTQQELRVMMLQLLGCSYEDIAQKLAISVNTVRSHIKAIYLKTRVHGPLDFYTQYFAPTIEHMLASAAESPSKAAATANTRAGRNRR